MNYLNYTNKPILLDKLAVAYTQMNCVRPCTTKRFIKFFCNAREQIKNDIEEHDNIANKEYSAKHKNDHDNGVQLFK